MRYRYLEKDENRHNGITWKITLVIIVIFFTLICGINFANKQKGGSNPYGSLSLIQDPSSLSNQYHRPPSESYIYGNLARVEDPSKSIYAKSYLSSPRKSLMRSNEDLAAWMAQKRMSLNENAQTQRARSYLDQYPSPFPMNRPPNKPRLMHDAYVQLPQRLANRGIARVSPQTQNVEYFSAGPIPQSHVATKANAQAQYLKYASADSTPQYSIARGNRPVNINDMPF